MANLFVLLFFSIALRFGECYNLQEHGAAYDVDDMIANHPVIKQLISRVQHLEEKDRLNSELIVKLTAELDKHKQSSTERQTPLVGPYNGSDADHSILGSDLQTKPLHRKEISEHLKHGKTHERIRQTIDEGTVAFFAAMTNRDQTLGPNQNVIFDAVDTNIGNGYNPHHGIFVAPVRGTYVFFSTVLANNGAEVWADIVVNGVDRCNFYARGTDGRHDSGSQMVVLVLNQGDDVAIQGNLVGQESIYGQRYTTFSGFLLSTTNSEIIG